MPYPYCSANSRESGRYSKPASVMHAATTSSSSMACWAADSAVASSTRSMYALAGPTASGGSSFVVHPASARTTTPRRSSGPWSRPAPEGEGGVDPRLELRLVGVDKGLLKLDGDCLEARPRRGWRPACRPRSPRGLPRRRRTPPQPRRQPAGRAGSSVLLRAGGLRRRRPGLEVGAVGVDDRLLVLGLDLASDAGVADLVAAGDVRDGHGDLLRLQLSQLLGDAGLDGVVLGLAQGEVDPVAVRGVEAVPELVDQVLRVDELREVGVAGGRHARAPAGQGLADAGVLLDVGPHLVDGRVELGELLGDRGAAVAEQFTELNAAINQMWTDVEEDPRVGEALTGWGSCMATAGYPDLAQLVDAENLVNELWNRFNAANGNRIDLSLGETEYDAVKASIPEELAELQAKEIAVAVADVTCRDEVGYTRIRREVETEYEQAIVDTYRADLEAWAASGLPPPPRASFEAVAVELQQAFVDAHKAELETWVDAALALRGHG